ncbi:glycogen debranching N-terminal domain-containing protein [Tessaracoccus lubricantis]|uniref:Glycogen debranching N-terminal domain-containing protein n=1 Tax=Tessaracoccus lubricantis TaxID=545543 RepID=A0ABP9F6L3_9ACTN
MKQPFLHRLVCILKAPVQWWSRTDGDLTGEGAEGIYCGDDRVVAGVRLVVASHEVEPIGHAVEGCRGRFTAVLRTPSEGADPVLTLTRHREVTGQGVRERVEVSSAAESPQEVSLTVTLELDATPMESIKVGAARTASAEPPVESDDGWTWHWRDANTTATLVEPRALVEPGTLVEPRALVEPGTLVEPASPASGVETPKHPDRLTLHWATTVDPGQSADFTWALTLTDTDAKFIAADSTFTLPTTSDAALNRLLHASAADLQALTLAERSDPTRYFLAAGAPWFFTLFGRDSLIAATMAARVAPDLALATLRTLAARQGRDSVVSTAEQPGKILHEVRRVALDLHDDSTVLPPEYYGTIDATPLWLMLAGRLMDLGRAADVADLLDNVIAALGWIRNHADPDGDGFLEYFDESGHGLANQGWKDSGDSIRNADGSIAEGPIVLLEVQGYAAAAARAGARILEEFGRSEEEIASAQEWRRYADDMAARIRSHFWVEDDDGPYPAIALDRHKRPVDGVASNMGHLLGLGVLNHDEERLVVERLTSPSMDSGYGIRTMSTTNGAYWPMRYHVGSVWTHDTAWIIDGMARAGFRAEAQRIARHLLRAAEGFDFRLPELFGGWSADEAATPMPYPASCRPQAWAAASAFVLADVLGS